MARKGIKIEVAYAMPEYQTVIPLRVPEGTTVEEAIRQSGIREHCPEMPYEITHVGVFGKARKLDDVVREGDRVEIYRPLKADPKEVRRRLAAEGKSMGSRGLAK